MKPSDGEVEFLRGGDVRFGEGTMLRVTNVKATKRGEETEISATLEVRATVTLANTGKWARGCGACGAAAPPPDEDGLWYILQNHDGNRLVFPEPEAEAYDDPERDQYPAVGWKRLEEMDVCGECWAEMQKALRARRKKSHRTGGAHE